MLLGTDPERGGSSIISANGTSTGHRVSAVCRLILRPILTNSPHFATKTCLLLSERKIEIVKRKLTPVFLFVTAVEN